jgi:hypothetical protein
MQMARIFLLFEDGRINEVALEDWIWKRAVLQLLLYKTCNPKLFR